MQLSPSRSMLLKSKNIKGSGLYLDIKRNSRNIWGMHRKYVDIQLSEINGRKQIHQEEII